MSITIEEVRSYLNRFSMAMGHWDESVARLAISQHEELETMRAQLAEKDAMLGKCVEALTLLSERSTGWVNCGDKDIEDIMAAYAAKVLASLSTTTNDDSPSVIGPPSLRPTAKEAQDVIAKVRNEALEEAAKAGKAAVLASEDKTPLEYIASDVVEAVEALKTEEKE
jgi:hypothetical protein